MKVIPVTQGSSEWLAARAQHFCASDASAAMGVSKFKSRSDLLREKATGYTPDVGPAKQRLFDAGHAAESAARVLVEDFLEEELFPCVGTLEVDGLQLLASLDGATMAGDIIWESKQFNAELAEQVRSGELAPHYWAQLEHALLVSGADRAYFTTTDGTLDRMVGTWYEPVPDRRAQVIAAWKQFAADLADYRHQPTEAAPVVVAAVQPSLPAVVVRMDGALTVASNLPDFAVALRNFIANIPAKPSTDQEFADAESACKALKSAESALEQAENNALSQMTDVEQMRRVVGDLRTLSKTTRLATEKLVAARKEAIRTEIYQEGIAAYKAHIDGLNKRIGRPYMPVLPVDFAGAIKNKRTVDSLRDAVNTHLANAKIAANDVADRISLNMATMRELAADHVTLFPDTAQLVLKGNDDLTALVKTRIAEHLAAEQRRADALAEQARERIAAEERAKAEARVREDQAAEDKLIAGIWEQARRIEGDRVGYIQKAISYFEQGPADFALDPRPRVAAAVAEARAEMQAKLAAAQDREARELVQKPTTAPIALPPAATVQAVADADLQSQMRVASMRAPSEEEGQEAAREIAAAHSSPPTMNLGKISAVLGFTVSAAFLQQIGCQPAKTERASVLYHDKDILTILEALGAHLQAVYSAQKAKYQPARSRTPA